MNRWIKTAAVALPLIASGYYLGWICLQFDQAFALLFSPSMQLLQLLGLFLLAVGAVLLSAGLAAGVVRPLWLGFVLFALSAGAVLISLPLTVVGGLLAFVYLIGGILYSSRVAKELEQRVSFSVAPMGQAQGILLSVLILTACARLYLGYAEYIREEGFSIPETYLELFADQMAEQLAADAPPEQREQAVTEFRREFQVRMQSFVERTLKPYEPWIPIAMAAGVFMTLQTIASLLSWIPLVALRLVFSLLRALKVTAVVTESREVERLTL